MMTPKQLEKMVLRSLRQNREGGRAPRSLYQLGQLTGIPRNQFTMVLHGKKASARVRAILEQVAETGTVNGGTPPAA